MNAYFFLSTGSGIGAHLKQLQLAFSLCESMGLNFFGCHGFGQRSNQAEIELFRPLITEYKKIDPKLITTIDDNLVFLDKKNIFTQDNCAYFLFQGWDKCRKLIRKLQDENIFRSNFFSRSDIGLSFLAHVDKLLQDQLTERTRNFMDRVKQTNRKEFATLHLRLGDTAIFNLKNSQFLENWIPRNINNSIKFIPAITEKITSPYLQSEILLNFAENALIQHKEKYNTPVVLLTDGFDETFKRIDFAMQNNLIQISQIEYDDLKLSYNTKLENLKSKFQHNICGEAASDIYDSIYTLKNADLIMRTYGSFADSVGSLLRSDGKKYKFQQLI